MPLEPGRLDHVVPYPPAASVGWALTIGPLVLVAAMSGDKLAATTGLAAAVIRLYSSRPWRPAHCSAALKAAATRATLLGTG